MFLIKNQKNFIILFILIFKFHLIKTWNLNSIKYLTNKNYTIKHVSVYYMRAFISIESINHERIPTLIEATWPENIIPMTPRIFPSIYAHALTGVEKCEKIYNAISTDVCNGKLWLIDNGTKFCPPKLIIYTIVPWNEKIIMEQITSIKTNQISSIVCDPNTINDSRAYISLYNKNYIMIYSLKTKKWWKLIFKENNNNNNLHLSSNFLINNNQRNFQPTELTINERNNLMYLSNYKTGDLYTMNLTKIRNYNEKKKLIKVQIKFLGNLLGSPKSLKTDTKGYLYYIIPRDGVVVRWNPKKALIAEKHDILFQISTNITQILFGIKGSIWIVTSTASKNDHCIRILAHYNSIPTLSTFVSNESEYY